MYRDANVTLMVSDMKRSIHFYKEVLGLKQGTSFGEEWVEMEAPNLKIGLHPTSEKLNTKLIKISMSIGLRVDDLDEAMELLKRRGVTFGPLFQDQGSRIAPLADPDGYPLYLIELKYG